MLQLSSKILIFSAFVTFSSTVNFTKIANAETKFNHIKIAEIKQDSYMGLRYEGKNLPRGLKDLGGWIVGDPYASRVYGISHVKKGNQQILWLEIVTIDKNRRNNHQVIDVLNLPKLNKSEQINSFCMLKGVRDPEIIVIAKYQDTEYFRNIKKAWRANRTSGKFEQISTQNIACENLGWGV
jgi:hypothetical protein